MATSKELKCDEWTALIKKLQTTAKQQIKTMSRFMELTQEADQIGSEIVEELNNTGIYDKLKQIEEINKQMNACYVDMPKLKTSPKKLLTPMIVISTAAPGKTVDLPAKR